MIEVMDDLSCIIRIPAPAARIVCLVPSITETLFILGAEERIAGITDYCIHPEEQAGKKTRVGGTKNIHIDKALALHPDLVIANAEENEKRQIERLQQCGLPVFVTFPKTVDGCLKMIADMASLTDSHEAAQPILEAIRQARAEALARAVHPRPRVLCPIWKDPYLTINRDTFIDNVIRHSGGENIFADRPERYPEFTLKDAAGRRPDIAILPTEPYHFTEADKGAFTETGCRRIHIVEGELLSWYGPRLARALRQLSSLITHPS
jgi:ABC-type Fe3+-hydroxamate transport system substrate-binding protein